MKATYSSLFKFFLISAVVIALCILNGCAHYEKLSERTSNETTYAEYYISDMADIPMVVNEISGEYSNDLVLRFWNKKINILPIGELAIYISDAPDGLQSSQIFKFKKIKGIVI